MTVGDILPLVKLRLGNLIISRNDEALITLINLGISELYERFNLCIKSETINVNDRLALYELRNEDVLILLALFDKFGRELRQTDVLESMKYDYKIVNYKTFVLRKPFNGYLYAVYKASNIPVKDVRDEIDLPDAMIKALLTYVTLMARTTINKTEDQQQEVGFLYQSLQKMYTDLEMQGYKIPLNTETLAVQVKGYV